MNEIKAIFTIGIAADMLGVHPRTLRIYEEEGLLKPARRGKWRYYTWEDLTWVGCLREMIHEKGYSIAAIKKLLKYVPCCEILSCPEEKSNKCSCKVSLF